MYLKNLLQPIYTKPMFNNVLKKENREWEKDKQRERERETWEDVYIIIIIMKEINKQMTVIVIIQYNYYCKRKAIVNNN